MESHKRRSNLRNCVCRTIIVALPTRELTWLYFPLPMFQIKREEKETRNSNSIFTSNDDPVRVRDTMYALATRGNGFSYKASFRGLVVFVPNSAVTLRRHILYCILYRPAISYLCCFKREFGQICILCPDYVRATYTREDMI